MIKRSQNGPHKTRYGNHRNAERLDMAPLVDDSAWAPLRHKLFRALWIAGLVANTALWMQNVGAAWLMTSLADSPFMVALVQTATTLPAFLFNLPGGVLADQIDRRRWLLFTQSLMLGSAGVLCILLVLDRIDAWLLLTLTFALGTGNALNLAAWSATVGDVVPQEEIPSALTLNSVSFNLARSLGPAIAGGIIGWTSVTTVFLLNGVCFALVVCILLGWRSPPRPTSSIPRERLLSGIRTGLRYIRYSPPARAVLMRTVTFVTTASALWALLPLVARDQAGFGPSGYGLLLGCLGAGAILGAFILPNLRKRIVLNSLVAGSSIIFAAIVLAAVNAPNILLLFLFFFIGGIAWMAGNSTASAVLQTNVPSWVRARGVSAYVLGFQGSMAIGGAYLGRYC